MIDKHFPRFARIWSSEIVIQLWWTRSNTSSWSPINGSEWFMIIGIFIHLLWLVVSCPIPCQLEAIIPRYSWKSQSWNHQLVALVFTPMSLYPWHPLPSLGIPWQCWLHPYWFKHQPNPMTCSPIPEIPAVHPRLWPVDQLRMRTIMLNVQWLFHRS